MPDDGREWLEDLDEEAEAQSGNDYPSLPGQRPRPESVRDRCPECGEEIVSNLYYIGGQGYLMVWECWGSLGENAQCTYRRVI